MKRDMDDMERVHALAKRAGISGIELLRMFVKVLNPVPYKDRPLNFFIGRAVEMAFEAPDGRPERMWVEVNAVTGRRLVGVLLNDPVRATHVRRGDRIELNRKKVLDIHRSRDPISRHS